MLYINENCDCSTNIFTALEIPEKRRLVPLQCQAVCQNFGSIFCNLIHIMYSFHQWMWLFSPQVPSAKFSLIVNKIVKQLEPMGCPASVEFTSKSTYVRKWNESGFFHNPCSLLGLIRSIRQSSWSSRFSPLNAA